MKAYKVLLIVLVVLALDQGVKIWCKTHMAAFGHVVSLKDYLHPDTKDPFSKLPPGEIEVIHDKFILHFTENPGMAFGMEFPGIWGKLILSLFRLGAAGLGLWYISNLIKNKAHWGFVTACTLILAGAIGNMIDGAFYGLIFTDSYHDNIGKVATLFPKGGGYAGFLQGHVVDMLWFPIVKGKFPAWFPIWSGQDFEFFRPIFNIADSAITTGVFIILIFQKKFFAEADTDEKPQQNESEATGEESQTLTNSTTEPA